MTRLNKDAMWKPLNGITAVLRENGHGELAILGYERIARRVLVLPVAPSYHQSAMYMLAIAYRKERRYHEAIEMLRAAVRLS